MTTLKTQRPAEVAPPTGQQTDTHITSTVPPAAAQDKPAVRMVPIAEIDLTSGPQVRSGCPKTVTEYAEALEAGATFPPIVLFDDGTAKHVADGRHRIAAALLARRKEILAEVRAGGVRDATWFGLGANRAHGLRLSAGDKTNAIRLALREFSDRSQRQIADQVGCSESYVRKVAEQLRTSAQLPPRPERTVGRDGKSRPAAKARRKPHILQPWELFKPENADVLAALTAQGKDNRLARPQDAEATSTAQPTDSPAGQTIPAAVPPAPPPAVADDDHDLVDPDDPVGYGSEAGELPCPFCGRRWVRLREYGGRRDPAHAHVECESCRAQGPHLTEWREDKPLPQDSTEWRKATPEELKREAVERWNHALRRPAEPSADLPPAERFFAQLWAVLEAKPRDAWPAAIEAMRRIIDRAESEVTP